ncbi:MAG: DUF922 domain-containing protein [Elusimicrobiota bacterium]
MKCPKCNQENPNDALYCAVCYEVLKKEAPKEETVPAQGGQEQSQPAGEPQSAVTASRSPVRESGTNYTLLIILFILFLAAALFYRNTTESEKWYKTAAYANLAGKFSNKNQLKFNVINPSEFNDILQNFPPGTVFDTYTVTGLTLEQIRGNLRNELSVNRSLSSRLDSQTFTNCKAEFTWDRETENTAGGAQWKTLSINVKNTVIYPVLEETAEISNEESNRWNILLKILMQHEAGRAKVNYAYGKQLEIDLLKLRAPDIKSLESMTDLKIQNFLRTIKTLLDEYDAKIEPGQKLVKLHEKL